MRDYTVENYASIKPLGVCDLEIAARILDRLCAISDAAGDTKSWQQLVQARLLVSAQVQTLQSKSRVALTVDDWTRKSV